MDVNDAVARVLKTEGVEWVGCFPSNNLIESVAKEGIRTIMFRQERGALMAADGYSRMNDRRKFGVAITQGGPGSENSHGGIAQAFSDNVPILYLAGGPALGQYAVRPNFSPARSYQSVSTHAEVITAPGQVAAVMRRAFHRLRNGRPGPVIVEIPADVSGQEVPESALNYQPPKRLLQSPSKGDVADAARLLLNAKKPVIWSEWESSSPRPPPSCGNWPNSPRSPSTPPPQASPPSTSVTPSPWARAAARHPFPPGSGYRSRTCCSPWGRV